MLQNSPNFAYAPASDMARARKFYEETLGFKPDREIEGGVSYKCASGTAFFLYPSPGAGTNEASQMFFTVSDLRAEVADLERRGVVFEEYDTPHVKTKDGIMETPGGPAAWFKDSEGNILAIIEER